MELARNLLGHHELVVTGEFAPPVELGMDIASILRSREVDVDFTVRTVYKGNVRPGYVVRVRLLSDMLAFPGEDVSRFEKRRQLYRNKREELQLAVFEAEQLSRAGHGSSAESDAHILEFEEVAAQLYAELQALRELGGVRYSEFRTHGSTFYQMGGAIEPNSTYVLAVNSIDGNPEYFQLPVDGFGTVVWGELARDVRSELEAGGNLITNPDGQQ